MCDDELAMASGVRDLVEDRSFTPMEYVVTLCSGPGEDVFSACVFAGTPFSRYSGVHNIVVEDDDDPTL